MKDIAKVSTEPQLAKVISIDRPRTGPPRSRRRSLGGSAVGEVIPFRAKEQKEVLAIINYYRGEGSKKLFKLAGYLAQTAEDLKRDNYSDSEVLESIQLIAAFHSERIHRTEERAKEPTTS